jgi:hypothetical protein
MLGIARDAVIGKVFPKAPNRSQFRKRSNTLNSWTQEAEI